jgi:hypothetical protein
MCNCGNKRKTLSQPANAARVTNNRRPPVQPLAHPSFEYTGKTPLIITGRMSGKQYRFTHPGNRQNIDPRDVPAILSNPALKKLG